MKSIQVIEKINEAGKVVKTYIFKDVEYTTKKAAEAARKEHLAKVKAQKQHEATKQDLAKSEKSLKNKKKNTKKTSDHVFTLNQQRKALKNELCSVKGWLKVIFNTEKECKELEYIRKCNKAGLFALADTIEKEMKVGEKQDRKDGKDYTIKVSKDLVLRWLYKHEKEVKSLCAPKKK